MYFVRCRNGEDEDQRTCWKCKNIFSTKYYKENHEQLCKGSKSTFSAKCRRPSCNYTYRLKHEKHCVGQGEENDSVSKVTSNIATASSATASSSIRSRCITQQQIQPVPSTSCDEGVRCPSCQHSFQSFQKLYEHRMVVHSQSGGNGVMFRSSPWQNRENLP